MVTGDLIPWSSLFQERNIFRNIKFLCAKLAYSFLPVFFSFDFHYTNFCLHVCICTTCILCPRRLEEGGAGAPGIMNCGLWTTVWAGTWTLALQSSKCSYLWVIALVPAISPAHQPVLYTRVSPSQAHAYSSLGTCSTGAEWPPRGQPVLKSRHTSQASLPRWF